MSDESGNPDSRAAFAGLPCNVGAAERWASAGTGVLLVFAGLRRRTAVGRLAALGGAMLLLRGATGFSLLYAALGRDLVQTPRRIHPVDLKVVLTVNRPMPEVHSFWRDVEQYPRFMRHLSEVRTLESGRSRWTAVLPGGLGTLSWVAEVSVGDDRVSWRSIPGSVLDNSGEVQFRAAPDSGTEVRARISYRAPAGEVGLAVSRLLSPIFNQMMMEDVRRSKHLLEAGEIPTTEGQPRG